jgi:hypothetical protein
MTSDLFRLTQFPWDAIEKAQTTSRSTLRSIFSPPVLCFPCTQLRIACSISNHCYPPISGTDRLNNTLTLVDPPKFAARYIQESRRGFRISSVVSLSESITTSLL